MADFDAQLPVRTIATEFTTEVANAAGTTINPAEDYAQGSTTSGENGVLAQGATTTAAPTYTTATTNPLSLDTAGNLRVTNTPSGLQNVNIADVGGNPVTTTVPVSGTVTANQGTPNTPANSWPVEITDGTNILGTAAHPVRTDPTGTTTQPVSGTVAVSNFPADADALAQASTTSGQLGALVMGAVTTAAPTYTTGQTDPLSIDTAGNLRVTVSNLTSSVPVLTYFTDAAVATSATVTHSVAGPCTLDAVHGAGSGEIKMTVAIGVTSSEVTYWQGFTSASNQNCEFALKNGYVIPSGSSVKVTLKNRDTAAQDLYLTIVTH
jgi:hypothetical protein